MKTICKAFPLVVIALFVLPGMATKAQAQDDQQNFAGKIGVSLDGLGDGNRGKPLIDLAKTMRSWDQIGGSTAAPLDEHGWPMSDAQGVLFDIRPFGTWKPPVDDPDNFQPDWSGTYKMSFQGQAVVEPIDETRPQVLNQKYDPASNITTADIVVPKGVGLLCLAFKQTKRTADSPAGSGITLLRVIRPGYTLDSPGLFTNEYIDSLKPFGVFRVMNWLDAQGHMGFYGDPGHHALNWEDRHLPDDATQSPYGKKYGVAWEYVIELAKVTGKDIWINIPVAATDDYVKNLAQLLKQKLPPKCNIYIEHDNEVWNFSFPQYTYNKLAAIDEVKQGNSKLNNDGSKDQEVWARRRHADQLVKIGNIFRDAFGPDDASRIRPVYASWLIQPKSYYEDVMEWVDKTYGPPKNYFYALADAAYYNIEKARPNASVADLLQAMRASSDSNVEARAAIQRIAEHYELKHCQYEVGPDTGGGKTDNMANRIEVNRDPGMKDLLIHDAQDNWFAHGGDIYIYFSYIDAYSRYGCWGLSEDIANLNTPKWQAMYQLTGATPPPAPAATPTPATPPPQ